MSSNPGRTKTSLSPYSLFKITLLVIPCFQHVAFSILSCSTGLFAADAFSFRISRPSSLAPRGPSSTTRLHEQPAFTRSIGRVSPSTLRKYDLPPSVCEEGWSAQIVTRPAKSLEESTEIMLIPKNMEEHFVSVVQVSIPIPLDDPAAPRGLGIELAEVMGGRDDGLGIVIVDSLVPGGNAERACKAIEMSNDGEKEFIMHGDSISSAELIVRRRPTDGSTDEQTDVVSATTECLAYDATAEALTGLLSKLYDSTDALEQASILLTLKRLRRRPIINVRLQYPPSQKEQDVTLQLSAGDNLRMAMLQRGVKLNDPLARRYDGKPTGSGNCGSGGLCRTCAVSVTRGGELLSPKKAGEEKMMKNTPRWRLACKSFVGYGMKEGDIVVQVNPRQW